MDLGVACIQDCGPGEVCLRDLSPAQPGCASHSLDCFLGLYSLGRNKCETRLDENRQNQTSREQVGGLNGLFSEGRWKPEVL